MLRVEKPRDLRNGDRGVGEDLQLRVMQALVVERPARKFQVAEADLDPLRSRRHDRRHLPRRAHQLRRRPLPVSRVEADDEIRVAEHIFRVTHVQRMARREVQAAVDIVNRDAGRLGELHERIEAFRLAPNVFGDDHRVRRRRRSDQRPPQAPSDPARCATAP